MKEFDVIRATDLQALVNSVQAYVKEGWVLKGEVLQQDNGFTQEVERPTPSGRGKKSLARQKSWVPWPKINLN